MYRHFKAAQKGRARVGTYTQCYVQNKQALRSLLEARASLHKVFVWESTSDGEWMSQVISPDDTDVLGAYNYASSSVTGFLRSWQPLMDSIAAIIQLALETSGDVKFKKTLSMTELVRLSKAKGWSENANRLKKTLNERSDWYIDKVRVMRNQLIHNERVAVLLPSPGSQRTMVELKKLEYDETSERFDLDQFIGWIYLKYLLFCSDVAEGIESLY